MTVIIQESRRPVAWGKIKFIHPSGWIGEKIIFFLFLALHHNGVNFTWDGWVPPPLCIAYFLERVTRCCSCSSHTGHLSRMSWLALLPTPRQMRQNGFWVTHQWAEYACPRRVRTGGARPPPFLLKQLKQVTFWTDPLSSFMSVFQPQPFTFLSTILMPLKVKWCRDLPSFF